MPQAKPRVRDPGSSDSSPRAVRRRDGSVAPFDAARIVDAVARAGREAGRPDPELGPRVADAVLAALAARFPDGVVPIEEIQDAVERGIVSDGAIEVARAYTAYRQRRSELRGAKAAFGVRDELKLSLNAAVVLKERYSLRDEDGNVTESTSRPTERHSAASFPRRSRARSSSSTRSSSCSRQERSSSVRAKAAFPSSGMKASCAALKASSTRT